MLNQPINIKCACCKAPATHNVTMQNTSAQMCTRHANEMQRDYKARIEPIEQQQGRRWTF
jgi:hypothetical protein